MTTVNNYPAQVPQNVLEVFDSYVPFGSDFIIYCSEGGTNTNLKYECLYRQVGSSNLQKVKATKQQDGSFTYQKYDYDDQYDGFGSTHPEYAYSNVTSAGRYHNLPSGQTVNTVMLLVIASICVLRLVFGGIKWTKSRKYRV